MSLKHFAMLSAISYYNQQNYNNNKHYNNTQTTFATTTTPESAYKSINSNKSTLSQLKQQQQQQSEPIIAATFLQNPNTTTTTAVTTARTSSTSLLTQPLNNNKTLTTTTAHKHYHQNGVARNDDTTSDINGDDSSSNYSSESTESLEVGQQTTFERHTPNTFTSTTYYGSGFGVFHQQNTARSNGGGIALITGSSANNGLSGGSYSHGINNNVNLLLGGAMLTLITTILCVVCYCCHRNIKKRTEAAYRQQRQWLENDPNMEIYSVEQCYETSGLFVGDSMDGLATIPALHHEPPPSYDAVVAMQEQQQLLIEQHHQQQLLMQQQLLQQQLATNSSPPPGYRSSVDISAIMQPVRGAALGGGSIVSGMEINSLASSTANIRTSNSISAIDPLLNYNDINGNVASPVAVSSTTTPTNNRTTATYLRNKQQQQQQRNVDTNQIKQLNMQKVLQAQSCCSLQRAEVENMWNAAAAALAARSAHLPSDVMASTTASTSTPTLPVNTRKQSQACKTSNTNTPETFGSRYLKQNYYRRGCPLCGKFRYDIDSTFSISMESNIDELGGTLAEVSAVDGQARDLEITQNNLNNNENLTNALENRPFGQEDNDEVEGNDIEDGDRDFNDKINANDNEVEPQCSCLNSIRSNVNIQQNFKETVDQQSTVTKDSELRAATASDNNANCVLATENQSTSQAASNNNNDTTNMEDCINLSSTSLAVDTAIPCSSTTANTSSVATSATSVTMNLDRINENGIISLDMSKIIDKTGLPTYDAALKLESSNYV